MRLASRVLTLAVLLAHPTLGRADIEITQGGFWTIDTRVAVTACVEGQCQSARDTDETGYSLPTGSIIQIQLQVFDCSGVTLDDYCMLAPGKGDRLRVRHCDKAALGDLLQSCSPYPGLRLRQV